MAGPMSATILNNFADVALSLPPQNLEAILKQNPALIDVMGYDGHTALQKAVQVGNLQVTQILLRCGADPNLRSLAGETSVHVACCRGFLTVFVWLLKHGGDPMVMDINGRVAVHCATQSGSLVLVQYLAEVCEVNLEESDSHGTTPLHIACAGGYINLVNYLVMVKKVSRTKVDQEGNTALHAAAMNGVSGVCWSVLSQGGEQLLISVNVAGLTPARLAHTIPSVPQDCVKWLDRWTFQFQKCSTIESPQWTWIINLFAPFFIFHVAIILSYVIAPYQQWLLGLPMFLVILAMMARQEHRIKHPVRWTNPVYVGAYGGGLASTLLCYIILMEPIEYLPLLVLGLLTALVTVHLFLFYYLVTSNPGAVSPSGPLKEVLRGLGEGVVAKYCAECQLAPPPLSHHCRLCGVCYHRTDHHCLFLNRCVALRNHWHFVLFVVSNLMAMATFLSTVLLMAWHWQKGEGEVVDRVASFLTYLLREKIWIVLMVVCNGASLLWGIHLLRLQLSVISVQQTTLCRLKASATVARFSQREKLSNLWRFFIRRRVPVGNTTHYFSQVY